MERGERVAMKGRNKKYRNRQIDKKKTRQVRIDSSVHQLLKIKAAESGETLRNLVEGCLADLLSIDENKKENNDET